MRIGLISDTHGLLRPEALDALRGCDHILHAGDIGGCAILTDLEMLAPVTAIRGNIDTGPWARELPDTRIARFGGVAVYMLHDAKTLDAQPPSERVDVILAGHSHQPRIEIRDDGVLLVNPGSAGRRRFRLPVTVGELCIGNDGCVEARIVPLLID